MLFLQTIMTNLVLNKSLDPKRHAGLIVLIFAGLDVCHTYLSGGGGRQ
jgi:hypothetical protein